MFGLFSPKPGTLDVRPLTDRVSVGPQIKPDQVKDLARQGIALVINCRPDGEVPGQPRSVQLADACAGSGLAYASTPVSGSIEAETIEAFLEAMEIHDGPVFAFCRSGLRAVKLWALANPEGLGVEDRLSRARDAGYDLSSLKKALRAQAER